MNESKIIRYAILKGSLTLKEKITCFLAGVRGEAWKIIRSHFETRDKVFEPFVPSETTTSAPDEKDAMEIEASRVPHSPRQAVRLDIAENENSYLELSAKKVEVENDLNRLVKELEEVIKTKPSLITAIFLSFAALILIAGDALFLFYSLADQLGIDLSTGFSNVGVNYLIPLVGLTFFGLISNIFAGIWATDTSRPFRRLFGWLTLMILGVAFGALRLASTSESSLGFIILNFLAPVIMGFACGALKPKIVESLEEWREWKKQIKAIEACIKEKEEELAVIERKIETIKINRRRYAEELEAIAKQPLKAKKAQQTHSRIAEARIAEAQLWYERGKNWAGRSNGHEKQ